MSRYTNLDGQVPDKTPWDVLRWKGGNLFRERKKGAPDYRTPRVAASRERILAEGPHMTWVGHASFLVRLGGQLIATDPVYGGRVGPVPRLLPAGLPEGELPPVDIVTVSHSHYDHLDLPSLRRIGDRPTYVVPRGNGELLRGAGLTKVIELDRWESTTIGGVRVSLVPAQHWSMRVPWDRNRRLWGGFVYESDDGVAYHSGDTAWNQAMFQAIHERFPRIDWAMLPIGAYDPEWFMHEQHINPEDAGRAWTTLGARYFCAMHWGTFVLTDEPVEEPPERIRAWFEREHHPLSKLFVFDVGETKSLPRA